MYDDDNELWNVDDDYDTNVVLHSNNVDTASIINNSDENESATIPNDNDSNIDNHIASIINKGGSTIINTQLLSSNNCSNLKGVVDSCYSIDQYIKYLQDTTKEVNKDMINIVITFLLVLKIKAQTTLYISLSANPIINTCNEITSTQCMHYCKQNYA